MNALLRCSQPHCALHRSLHASSASRAGPLPCPADRLLDTGNQDLILKMFRRFPKAGTGVARLQVGRGGRLAVTAGSGTKQFNALTTSPATTPHSSQ